MRRLSWPLLAQAQQGSNCSFAQDGDNLQDELGENSFSNSLMPWLAADFPSSMAVSATSLAWPLGLSTGQSRSYGRTACRHFGKFCEDFHISSSCNEESGFKFSPF